MHDSDSVRKCRRGETVAGGGGAACLVAAAVAIVLVCGARVAVAQTAPAPAPTPVTPAAPPAAPATPPAPDAAAGSVPAAPVYVPAPGPAPAAGGTPGVRLTDRESPPGTRPRARVRRPKGLMIAGIVTLGASYGLTALVGLQMMSGNINMPGATCTNCDTVGPRLLIPIAGPWAALPAADGDDGKVVMALLGVAQATGLLMTIVGVKRYQASATTERASTDGGSWLAVVPTKGGALGTFAARF